MRRRVDAARARQLRRFRDAEIFCNAQMTTREIRHRCVTDDAADHLLEAAMNKLALSARAYTRILKVARTVADIDGDDTIGASQIGEAIQYRSLDRPLA